MDCVKQEEYLDHPRSKPETGHNRDIEKNSNTQGASEKGTENITTAQRIGPLRVFLAMALTRQWPSSGMTITSFASRKL